MNFRLIVIICLLLAACSSPAPDTHYQDSLIAADSLFAKSKTVDVEQVFLPAPDYQNETGALGIGVCRIHKDHFLLYDDTLKSPDSVFIYEPQYKAVYPLLFKPDYGVFWMVVLEYGANYCKVQRNESEVAYIPLFEIQAYSNWENFLLDVPAVENVDPDLNPPLTDTLNPNSTVYFNEDSPAKVTAVSGNWIHIQNEEGQQGRIKWKANGRLLVRLLMLD